MLEAPVEILKECQLPTNVDSELAYDALVEYKLHNDIKEVAIAFEDCVRNYKYQIGCVGEVVRKLLFIILQEKTKK